MSGAAAPYLCRRKRVRCARSQFTVAGWHHDSATAAAAVVADVCQVVGAAGDFESPLRLRDVSPCFSLFRVRFPAQPLSFSLSLSIGPNQENQPTKREPFSIGGARAPMSNNIRWCTIRNHAHRLEMDSPTTTTTTITIIAAAAAATDERNCCKIALVCAPK